MAAESEQPDIQSGLDYVEKEDYEKAYACFLKSYFHFIDNEDLKAVDTFKLMLMCRIMSHKTVHVTHMMPPQYSLESLDCVRAISDALSDQSVKDFIVGMLMFKNGSHEHVLWYKHLHAVLDWLIEFKLNKELEKKDEEKVLTHTTLAQSFHLDSNEMTKELKQALRRLVVGNRIIYKKSGVSEVKKPWESNFIFKVAVDNRYQDDIFFLESSCNKVIFCWLTHELSDCILPVRNQGKTNSCFAFVFVDRLFATLFLQANEQKAAGKEVKEPILKGSEQELLDRIHDMYPMHQSGDIDPLGPRSNYHNAYLYVHNRYLATDEDLPFLRKCATIGVDDEAKEARLNYIELVKKLGPGIYAGNFHKIKRSDVVNELKRGPVMASVFASVEMMRWDDKDKVHYPSSDAQRMKKERVPNHAVLLVGYGMYMDNKIFYIAKSSWGQRWGHKGFMKIDERICFDFSTLTRCKLVYNERAPEPAKLP